MILAADKYYIGKKIDSPNIIIGKAEFVSARQINFRFDRNGSIKNLTLYKNRNLVTNSPYLFEELI